MHEALTGTPTKTAVPCVRCGTTGGHPRHQGGPPRRNDGSRFGYDGKLCHSCWMLFMNRELNGKKVLPCAKCGTDGGAVGKDGRRPKRYSGERIVMEGFFCADCFAYIAAEQGIDLASPRRSTPNDAELEERKEIVRRAALALSRDTRQTRFEGEPEKEPVRRVLSGVEQARHDFREAMRRIRGERWETYAEREFVRRCAH